MMRHYFYIKTLYVNIRAMEGSLAWHDDDEVLHFAKANITFCS